MKKVLLVVIGVLLLGATVYALTPLPPAPARVLGASGYNPMATAHIAGWDWLRATDARVEWTFDTTAWSDETVRDVYLNFAGLVTNGVSGGSGYDAKIRFWVVVPDGGGGRGPGHNEYSTVAALNPFRPQNPINSSGVGYRVYGHGGMLGNTLIRQAIEAGELKVMATWTVDTVTPVGRHYAVNKPALTLGYISNPGAR